MGSWTVHSVFAILVAFSTGLWYLVAAKAFRQHVIPSADSLKPRDDMAFVYCRIVIALNWPRPLLSVLDAIDDPEIWYSVTEYCSVYCRRLGLALFAVGMAILLLEPIRWTGVFPVVLVLG